jgi:hypothetical protein
MTEDLTTKEIITVEFHLNGAGKLIHAKHPKKGPQNKNPQGTITDNPAVQVTTSSPGVIYVYAMGKWWCIGA